MALWEDEVKGQLPEPQLYLQLLIMLFPLMRPHLLFTNLFPSSKELLLTPEEGDVAPAATLQAEKQRSVAPFPETHSSALSKPFRPSYTQGLLQGGPQTAAAALSALSASSSFSYSHLAEEYFSVDGWARLRLSYLALGPTLIT